MKNILSLFVLASILCGGDLLKSDDNKTVLDTSSNLQWQDDVSSVSKTWTEAIAYCEDLTLEEYSDWRLPNRNELLSIVDYNKYNPAIKEDVFTHITSSYCWSSTTYASNTSYAWRINFNNGGTYNYDKTNSTYVRCVRGRQ